MRRKATAVLTALGALVCASAAVASVSATVSPTSVDFGRVPFEGGCAVEPNGVPNALCVTRTVTVTNRIQRYLRIRDAGSR